MEFFKQHKETENKVHESLYNNLALLSAVFPTTPEFDTVFRRDMFVKNNKVAFFEVIHYLLNILNPELTKQKLPSWPIYDVKKEAKFRSELVGYINELNVSYENADIPQCQPSSLISPGGFRFAKFMLKISQLVLYEYLRKSNNCQLYHLKPHRNLSVVTKAQLCNLKKETQLIESETKEFLQDFNKHHQEMSSEAEQLTKSLTEANKSIQKSKIELEKTQEEFNVKYPSYPSVSSLEDKLVVLKEQLQKILELQELFKTSEKLLQYISGSKLSLEHNEDNLIIPNEICHLITDKKELSLTEYFKGVAMLLERKAMQLHSPTNSCIEQTIETINIQSLKYEETLKQLKFQQDHISKLCEVLKPQFKETLLKNESSPMAVML